MSLVLRTASRTKDDMDEAIATLNEKFNSYKSIGALQADQEFVYKAGELVRQLAEDMFLMSDPTDLIYERRAGPQLGQWYEFEEHVNTARVVQRSLGGKPRVFTPHKKKYEIQPEDWRVDFGFKLELIGTGQIDVRVWVEQMADAISRYYVEQGLNALDIACAAGVEDAHGRPVRTVVNADDVTTTGINEALRRLGDVNPDTMIIGRYYALYPLFSMDSSLSEVSHEEFRQRGAIGRFRGATVVVLRDSYNPFYKKASVPVDRIYIAGGEKGAVLSETNMSSFNYSTVDPEELHFRVGTKGRTSFDVFKPWKYHVIEIAGNGEGE
jgi:hypothetical protein